MNLRRFWGVVQFFVPVLPVMYSFEGSVCLETVLKFGLSDVACHFKEKHLETWFTKPPLGFPCKDQCTFNVDLRDKKPPFEAKKLQVFYKNEERIKLFSRCQSNYEEVDIKVKCPSREVKVYFGLICSTDSDCWKNNTSCYKSGKIGTCSCKDGFILINGSCKQDGLVLGRSCDVDKQCTGSAYSRNCSMRKCVCQTGYYNKNSQCYTRHAKLGEVCVDNKQCSETTANSCCENSTMFCNCCPGFYENQNRTRCERNGNIGGMKTATPKSQPGTTEPNSEHQMSEKIIDEIIDETYIGIIMIAGAGVGCFALGVVVSLGIVFILRKRGSQRNQNSDLRNSADNQAYGKHIECGESKRARTMPDTVSSLPSTMKNTSYSSIKRFSPEKEGDIYNHLHETETHSADLDDYDHAKPSREQLNPERDYSHLNDWVEEPKDREPNKDVQNSEKAEENTDKNTDNYFTLEKID